MLTIEYKSNIIRFKLDEDPLQSRFIFLTFVESLEVIFYQYEETCEVLLDYPKIGGKSNKYVVKKAIRTLLHANINVQSRRFIAEFPVDGVKYIAKLQSHCSNMTFDDKSRYDRIFNKSHIKEGNLK